MCLELVGPAIDLVLIRTMQLKPDGPLMARLFMVATYATRLAAGISLPVFWTGILMHAFAVILIGLLCMAISAAPFVIAFL